MGKFGTAQFPWRQFPPNLDIYNSTQLMEWIEEASDPRVADWPMMQSFVPTVGLCLAYVAFVVLGTKWMSDRKAYDLRHAMTMYNIFLIVLNGYMLHGLVHEIVTARYTFLCHPVDYSQRGLPIARIIYMYYLSKLIDFCDTVFMVLRKKVDQVTFLHVYHHALMFPIWWLAVKFAAGGSAAVCGPTLNAFIHVIMYGYYLAATFKIHIPGKRHVTQLQIVQLVTCVVHSMLTIAYDCDYPHWTMYAQIAYVGSLIVLFINFYFQAYLKKKEARRAASASARPKTE